MKVLGIDDAGRGPLIGPMILAGVLIDDNVEAFLKKHPIKDSKALQHSMRIALAKVIEESALGYEVVATSASQIDESLRSGINLNTLEAMKTAEIINSLNPEKEKIKVIVDCPSVNLKAWRLKVVEFITRPSNLELVCEHKADVNHLSVAAASILAKVMREEEVSKLKKEFGNIGSGYPSDPDTKKFLAEHGSRLQGAGIFRKTWSTWKKQFPESNRQKTLGSFS